MKEKKSVMDNKIMVHEVATIIEDDDLTKKIYLSQFDKYIHFRTPNQCLCLIGYNSFDKYLHIEWTTCDTSRNQVKFIVDPKTKDFIAFCKGAGAYEPVFDSTPTCGVMTTWYAELCAAICIWEYSTKFVCREGC